MFAVRRHFVSTSDDQKYWYIFQVLGRFQFEKWALLFTLFSIFFFFLSTPHKHKFEIWTKNFHFYEYDIIDLMLSNYSRNCVAEWHLSVLKCLLFYFILFSIFVSGMKCWGKFVDIFLLVNNTLRAKSRKSTVCKILYGWCQTKCQSFSK